MKPLLFVALVLTVCAMISPAVSHNGAMGPTLERMNAMTDLQKAIKSIALNIKSGNIDTSKLKASIDSLKKTGERLPALFLENHLPPASEASPKIWTDPEGFVAQIELFNQKLRSAETEFDAGDLASGMKELAASCKGCHTAFRMTKD